MAAQLIDEGTSQHDAVEIANAFEQVGARFSVAAHRDMFVVRLRSLSDPKKLDAAVSTMLEVLKDSTFKNNSIEPYPVCRRVNILRDYPDDKIKIYP